MTENNLQFESKGHRYYLDGKPLTGVTTIIGILDKPQLISWAANCAVDYVENNFPTAEDLFNDPLSISRVLSEARTAWAKKRDAAGDIGTEVHQHIEDYAKSKISGSEFNPQYSCEKVQKMVERFISWAIDEKVTFLLSEQKLYSERYWYAGTMDLLVEIKGKKYIADIKTAKDIYTSNYIQMAGYHIALEELGKVKDLMGYIVINIPKELKENGDVKFKEKRIYNTEEFKDAFINCLELYRFINKEKPEYLKKKK